MPRTTQQDNVHPGVKQLLGLGVQAVDIHAFEYMAG